MKWNLTLAALMGLACSSAQAEWWVGLQTSGVTTPSNAISVFDNRASGNTSPVRTIGGDTASLRSIADLWLDATNGTMVVADFRGNQIVRFGIDSSGNTAPATRYTHPAISQPRRLAAIPAHNEFAVLASSGVFFVAMNAPDGSAFNRLGFYSQSNLNNPFGLAYMPTTDEIAVGDFDVVDSSNRGEIRFFARADDGVLATTRRVFGTNSRLGTFVVGLEHDPINQELIALVRDEPVNGQTPGRIVVFTESADGDVSPIREIAGDASQLINVTSLGFNPASGEIAVGVGSQTVPLAVLVFNRTDQGNAAPKQRLSGALTGLNLPDAVGAISAAPDSGRLFTDSFE